MGRLDGLVAALPYLSGRDFGLADVAYVPWVLRARDMLGVSLDGQPALEDWVGATRGTAFRRRRGRRGGCAVTLVLLHALPLDPRMWEPQVSALDEPAVGARRSTTFPVSRWTPGRTAVLEAVEGRLLLVGASMGGYCALAAARRAPERVAGLVLVGSRAEADPPERRQAREEQLRTIAEGGAAALWESMAPRLFAAGTDSAIVDAAREIALEQPPDGLARRGPRDPRPHGLPRRAGGARRQVACRPRRGGLRSPRLQRWRRRTCSSSPGRDTSSGSSGPRR